jgi:hypothetical protein
MAASDHQRVAICPHSQQALGRIRSLQPFLSGEELRVIVTAVGVA